MMRRILIVCLIIISSLLPTITVLAKGPQDGRVIFGEDFTLESGEELDGDLVVFGGDVILEEGSLVDGEVVVMGGSAIVAGEVEEDLVVFGGMVKLEETAVIDGDLVVLGGIVEREEGAVVEGDIIKGLKFGLRFPTFPFKLYRWPYITYRFFFDVFKAFVFVFALTALGILIVLFWPEQTKLVSEVILTSPLPCLGVGVLSLITAFGLTTLLALTICFSPLAILMGIAVLVAGLFGWVAVGLLVGQKLVEALKLKELFPLVTVAIGVLFISLLGVVPCLGKVFTFFVGSLGLGAVILTRFGTLPYPAPPPKES